MTHPTWMEFGKRIDTSIACCTKFLRILSSPKWARISPLLLNFSRSDAPTLSLPPTLEHSSCCQITCCVPSGDGDTQSASALGHGPHVKPTKECFGMESLPWGISNLLARPQPHASSHHSNSRRPALCILRQSCGVPDIWVSSRTQGGRMHATGRGAEGWSEHSWVCLRPPRTRTGPGAGRGPRAWALGPPGLSPLLGLADGKCCGS